MTGQIRTGQDTEELSADAAAAALESNYLHCAVLFGADIMTPGRNALRNLRNVLRKRRRKNSIHRMRKIADREEEKEGWGVVEGGNLGEQLQLIGEDARLLRPSSCVLREQWVDKPVQQEQERQDKGVCAQLRMTGQIRTGQDTEELSADAGGCCIRIELSALRSNLRKNSIHRMRKIADREEEKEGWGVVEGGNLGEQLQLIGEGKKSTSLLFNDIRRTKFVIDTKKLRSYLGFVGITLTKDLIYSRENSESFDIGPGHLAGNSSQLRKAVVLIATSSAQLNGLLLLLCNREPLAGRTNRYRLARSEGGRAKIGGSSKTPQSPALHQARHNFQTLWARIYWPDGVKQRQARSPPIPLGTMGLASMEDRPKGGKNSPWKQAPEPDNGKPRPPIYNPEDYAASLRKMTSSAKEGSNGTKATMAPQGGEMTLRQFATVTDLLNKLRVDLKLAFPSFVQEFVGDGIEGVTLLLELLRVVQLSQASHSGRPPPPVLRRSLLDEHACLQCLSACLRCQDAARRLASSPAGLFSVAVCIMSSVNKSLLLALE
ncbi:hypothetical protein LSTR_LSTR006290, partial [Laodelphax striatellus]